MLKNCFVFKTYKSCYIYDAYCNKFTKVTDQLYNEITNNDLSYTSSKEYDFLKEKGFFQKEKFRLIPNPATEMMEYLLERQLTAIVLQLTQGCNLRCLYCPFSQKNDSIRHHSSKQMSWEIAKKSIDLLCEHSVDSKSVALGFYGGEPLLRFDLIKKSVNYIKTRMYGKKVIFSITSNATLLTEDMMSFFDNNEFVIVISLDGYKKSNDANRKFSDISKSVFDTVISKILIIRKKYKNIYKHLMLNMVLDPSINYDEYERILYEYPFLKEINIDIVMKDDTYSDEKNTWTDTFSEKYFYKVFLNYLVSIFGFSFPDELFLFRNIQHLYDKDVYSSQSIVKNLNTKDCITPTSNCLVGQRKLFVSTSGGLYPCERVNESDEIFKLGDISEGFDMRKVESTLNFYQFFNNRCSTCFAIQDCKMCLHNFGPSGLTNNQLTNDICIKYKSEFIETIKQRAIINEARNMIGEKTNEK